MRLSIRVLLLLLLLPAFVWAQTQVINGNRVQAGWINYGTTAGTATAYTLTFSPPLPGYVTGQCFLFKPHVANTGAATLDVQTKGALPLTKLSGGSLVPLVAGDLVLGRLVWACYDGTSLQLMGTAADAGGVTDTDKGDITVTASGTVWTIDTSAVTYAKIQNVSTNARLLGRNTTGAGPIEELTTATVKAMLGLSFGDLSGSVSDAQIPDLNTLTTGLTPSRCVETDGTGKLGVAAASCGTGGGATGISGATNHGLMVATGGTTGTSLPAATNGQLPIGSLGADPVLAPLTGTANQIAVTNAPGSITLSIPTNPILPGTTTANLGNATNLPLATGVTGDLPYANLTPSTAASRLLGRGAAAGAGDWQEVIVGTTLSMVGTTLNTTNPGLTDGDKGDLTVSSTGTVWAIDNTAVTYAKIQNVSATARLLGRNAAGAGPIEELPPATVKTMLGLTSDGTIHAADYGVVCDGTTNTTAFMQAALNAAKVGTQGRTLSMPLATGACMIHTTLTIQNVQEMHLLGNDVTFQWAGGTGSPMFLFQDVRDSHLEHFRVQASSTFPVATILQFENGSGTSIVPTNNTVEHVIIECTNGGCTDGIRMALGAGGDNNNDFNRFVGVVVQNPSRACVSIEHSQSKTNVFEDFECANNGVGDHIIHNAHGSFFCVRCRGGGSTAADFHIVNSYDQNLIDGGNFENSARLLESGFTGASVPITIRNSRWAIANLHADNEAIKYQAKGPLILENVLFEPATLNRALVIRGGWSTAGSFIATGNYLSSTLANPFVGIQPSLSQANLINRNDGNDIVLLDGPLRLGAVVAADLAAVPFSTAANGTQAYCSNCIPGPTCTGGGTGALAVRLNGAWTCVSGGGAGGSSAFSALTGGTNTTAAMVVGTGASLAPTGTGAITATRTVKQVLTPSATTTPVAVNYSTHNRVRVDGLNQDTTFSIPTGSPNDGDFLEYSIACAVQRGLTFTTGVGGFSPGYGIALPTACRAGGLVLYGFVWNSATSRWEFVATTGAGVGYVHLPIGSAQLPASNPAVIDGSENNRRLRFDDASPECAWWQFRMPPDYLGNPVLKLQYSMFNDVTAGHTVAFDASLMAVAPGSAADANNDSYGTPATACDDAAIPTTIGGMKEISCAITNTDGAAAGHAIRLKVCRVPARDNSTTDAEILNAMLEFSK